MLQHLRPALVMLVLFTLLTGLAYPLAVTGIARIAFPHQANGSLISRRRRRRRLALIGQNFKSARYFHPPPVGDDRHGPERFHEDHRRAL